MRSKRYTVPVNGQAAAERSSVDPVPGVPMVRVVDERGREVARGWYVRHECRQVCPIEDSLKPADVAHLVAVSDFADWNMPRDLLMFEVTPPHRIEVISC